MGNIMELKGLFALFLSIILFTSSAQAELIGKEKQYWKTAVKPYMDSILKDPFSAHYRDLKVNYHVDDPDRPVSVCGWVNSKNSYGGYVGWDQFLAHEDNVYFKGKDEFARAFIHVVCDK